jgi:hypothetical protein
MLLSNGTNQTYDNFTIGTNFSVAVFSYINSIELFADRIADGSYEDIESKLNFINYNSHHSIRNVSHELNDKVKRYGLSLCKSIKSLLLMLVGIASGVTIVAQLLLLPKIFSLYNVFFGIIAIFFKLDHCFSKKKPNDCLFLLNMMEMDSELAFQNSILLSKQVCQKLSNSQFELLSNRKKELACLGNYFKSQKKKMILRVLVFLVAIIVIAGISIYQSIAFSQKTNSSLIIFHTMNVRRPYLTASMYSMFEEAAVQYELTTNQNINLFDMYSELTLVNEENFVESKYDLRRYYPSFYNQMMQVDSNSSCTFIPANVSECTAMYDSFMTFGLLKGYNFLLTMAILKGKEVKQLIRSNISSIGLLRNVEVTKGNEIKACYINYLLQSSLMNFTDEFQKYLSDFITTQEVMLTISLLFAVIIFIVYLQALLKILETKLTRIKRLLYLFPTMALMEHKELFSGLVAKYVK